MPDSSLRIFADNGALSMASHEALVYPPNAPI